MQSFFCFVGAPRGADANVQQVVESSNLGAVPKVECYGTDAQ